MSPSPSTESDAVQSILDQAIAQHHAGNLTEAADLYNRAIQRDPQCHLALAMLGTISLQCGEWANGRELLDAAVRISPEQSDYHFNLALALDGLGERTAAEAEIRKALDIAPRNAGALNQLGVYLRAAGELEEARKVLSRATRIDPSAAEPWVNLTGTLGELGLDREAMTAARKTLRRAPDHPEAHFNLGRLLVDADEPEAARECFERAIALQPSHVEALGSMANVLIALNRPKEAEDIARHALELAPEHRVALTNLGLALLRQAHYEEAVSPLKRAVERYPNDSTAVSNLACSLLALGRFDEGWPLYERMLETDVGRHTVFIRDRETPRWQGGNLAGKSILLSAEQGVGEQIMFASYIPELLAVGARVGYGCDERLVPMFARALPDLAVFGANVGDASPGGYDFFLPVGSLPGHFSDSTDRFPKTSGFLGADPALTDTLRDRYRNGHDGPVIGISWRSASRVIGIQKNAPVSMWGAILGLPGCRFVSVQYGDVRDEVKEIKKSHGVEILVDDDVDALKNIDANAAQMCACDLIISISNATLHIAGACGVPTLAIVGSDPNWYWRLDESGRSVWYASVDICRQLPGEDWVPVINKVAEAARARLEV